jgi:hypothetical protein
MKKILLVSLCLVLVASLAVAKNAVNGKSPSTLKVHNEVKGNVNDRDLYPVQQTGAFTRNGTTYLAYYQFEGGVGCDQQGWTSVDITAQADDYFHVDDFSAGPGSYNSLYPIEGGKSMWCGTYPKATPPECAYAVLPGYGNGWNQAFCSPCFTTADTAVVVDYYVQYDSEPGYDWTTLEYAACTNTPPNTPTTPYVAEPSILGGAGQYDGNGGPIFESISISTTGSVMVRFHFTADGAWSDEDGLWDTDGAIIIDSLTVSDNSGTLVATETFEGRPVGDNDGNNWFSCTPPGYGDLAMLVQAVPTTYQNNPVEEDPCAANFTCLWLFVSGSTANYACNTPQPSGQQAAIPYVNARNQYISNEIWSPWIDYTDGGGASGAVANLVFDVYRDLKLDALIFYVWHVRSRTSPTACPSGWVDRNFVYYGGGKDWLRVNQPFGDIVQVGTTDIQVALGVVDMCPFWCGLVGSGACHAHAPMFDNVEIYRVAVSGPQFSVRDIDMLHDNFASDGTITGTCRVDMAQDILPSTSAGITHGDSAKVTVTDPEVGLGIDPTNGGPTVYCFFSVDGGTYTGAQMEAPETRTGAGYPGDKRYPYIGSVPSAGRTWEYFRMDTMFTNNGGLVADQYCIDLNDNLFVPGDTLWFFFGASGSTGIWTYFSLPAGSDNSMNIVAQLPDELTMLPAVGDEPGNDILYVDGMNFRGAQPFFDTAFRNMNIFDQIDRYDIRGPSSGVGNRPGSRVVNVLTQLIPIYNKIIWNTGDLTLGCIGDGVGYEKSDDASMLYTFCDLHSNLISGIYFSGDDLADELLTLTGPGAIALRTAYINYTLVNPDHVAAGAGVNPALVDEPTGAIFAFGDSAIAYGGCPLINDFDVIAPNPPLSAAEMHYARYHCPQTPGTHVPVVPSAVLSQATVNAVANQVNIVLSGFSYHYIRDITTVPWPIRYTHMQKILLYLGNIIDEPIAARPNARTNSLAQNYPNPFNPTTTIKYTIKEQAHVSLRVYNVAGQLVRTLVDEVQKPDAVAPITWNGMNNAGQQVSSGVYFYKLVTKNFTQTKKMVLLK